MDVFSFSCVLHQWKQPTQVEALKRVVELTRPGALGVGMQTGSFGKNLIVLNGKEEKEREVFCHNPETWRDLWEKVGEETGTKWLASETMLRSFEELDMLEAKYLPEGTGILQWVVRRVE